MENYTKHCSLQKRDATDFLRQNINRLKFKNDGTETILDLGCGPGVVTFDILFPVLPQRYRKLIGVDRKEGCITEARAKFHDTKIAKNVTFRVADIESDLKKISAEFGVFDYIFSFYCLHWIRNHRKLLSHTFEILNRGGTIFFVFLATNPIYIVWENLQKNSKWSPYMTNLEEKIAPYQTSADPKKEYEEILKSVGFIVKTCDVEERVFEFPSVEELRSSVKAMTPFNIPEDQIEAYMDDYVEEIRKLGYINHEGDKENVRFSYKLFFVVATKPCTCKKKI